MIKLIWGYDNGKVRHDVGEEVSFSKDEEKRLVDAKLASYVGGPAKEEAINDPDPPQEEIPPANPEGEPTVPPAAELPDPEPEPESSKKRGPGRRGATDDES